MRNLVKPEGTPLNGRHLGEKKNKGGGVRGQQKRSEKTLGIKNATENQRKNSGGSISMVQTLGGGGMGAHQQKKERKKRAGGVGFDGTCREEGGPWKKKT